MSLGLSSPKDLSTQGFETMPAFQINSKKGIPEKATIRTNLTARDRMDSLMSVPRHKQGTKKFDKSTDARTIAPLTSEDINQFHNLGLMTTLRADLPAKADKESQGIVDQAPSFFDDDMKKREEKYGKSIRDRQQFKRTYFS